MAAKTFLTQSQYESVQLSLKNGSSAADVSKEIEGYLSDRLSAHPLWRKARPVAIGSWARHELSLKSDIDIIFLGDEKTVVQVTTDLTSEGLRLRSRVPAQMSDWRIGVEAFDVMALLDARALHEDDLELVSWVRNQREQVLAMRTKDKLKLIREMQGERKLREERYDGLANYLEPNIKFGPGGLRDIQQALSAIKLLAPESARAPRIRLARALQALNDGALELLFYRQKAQSEGGLDTLSSALQKELSDRQGSSIKDFMGRVQILLSDISFYTDFVFNWALSSEKQKDAVQKEKIETIADAFRFLSRDSSLLAQERVRYELAEKHLKLSLNRGQFFSFFNVEKISEKAVIAFFRSGLMGAALKDLARVRGLVQHDQYHRLTVDAHTLQAVREVLRVRKSPGLLGKLKKHVVRLSEHDWNVVLFSALFHDLGKGLEGDHSGKGAAIVKRELTRLGCSLRLTVEVVWMVKNHLLLSGAAFRQNPQSPATWQWLFSNGLEGRRIPLLTVFTAIDIRATNIEAWNSWKENLLFELARALESPKAEKVQKFLQQIEKSRLPTRKEFFERLDPAVIENLPSRVLLKDYKALVLGGKASELGVEVVRTKRDRLWIRFHSRVDEAGLFLRYVQSLYSVGARIQEAYVQTFSDWGVYDWFFVSSSKPLPAIKKLIEMRLKVAGEEGSEPVQAPAVRFERVDLVRADGDRAILSFRGEDQKGALLAAVSALHAADLSIEWARIHTWGRQIEDAFAVQKGVDVTTSWDDLLAQIQKAST